MLRIQPSRRELLAAIAASAFRTKLEAAPPQTEKPVVAIVKIRNGRTEAAVE